MMGFRLRSLSGDGVDTFTHFWSVALFLILAIILLTVPDNKQSVPRDQPSLNDDPPTKPTQEQIKVHCWCPAQFEESQVNYANEVCAGIYQNSKTRGSQYDESDGVVGRYNPSGPSIRTAFKSLGFNTSPENESVDNKNSDNNDNENNKTAETDQTDTARLQRPVVVLFILTFALLLPKIVCSILSRCCGCVNLERTLESAEKGDAAHHGDRRQQMYAGLVKAFKDSIQVCGKTATFVYMLMKFLIIAVLVAEILVVRLCLLPQLHGKSPSPEPEETSMQSTTTVPTTTTTQIVTTSTPQPTNDTDTDTDTDSDTGADPSDPSSPYSRFLQPTRDSPIFHCFFKIRQMQNVHDYTVQCIVDGQPQQEMMATTDNYGRDAPATLMTTPTSSMLTDNVLVIVLANLVILLVVQILNTLMWVVSLISDSTPTRLGLPKDSPLDLVLLVQMARSNLGIGVSAGLAEALGECSSSKEEEENEFLLQKV